MRGPVASAAQRSELRAHWRPLFACFVGMMFAVGTIVTYTSGVFTIAISRDFNWSRLDLALPVMAFYYVSVPASLACGLLIDRIGPRRPILASSVILAAALTVVSLLPASRTAFVAVFATIAIGAAGTMPMSYARVIVGRFERQRGVALGIALTGVGVGAAILPVLSQWLVDVSDWRAAYRLVAVMIVAISLPCGWIFIEDGGETTDPAAKNRDRAGAFRNRRAMVAMLLGISVLSGAVLTGLIVHLIPILRERSFDGAAAARIAGLMGVSVVVGRVAIGLLMDRFQASRVLALFLVGPAIGAGLLAVGVDGVAVALAAVLIGLAQGAEVDAMAFLISRHFDQSHFGVLYGAMFAGFTFGAANGPLAIAWASSGGYGPALLVAAALAATAALLSLLLPPYRV